MRPEPSHVREEILLLGPGDDAKLLRPARPHPLDEQVDDGNAADTHSSFEQGNGCSRVARPAAGMTPTIATRPFCRRGAT